MRIIIGTAVLAIVAVHASPTFHRHAQMLRAHHAATTAANAGTLCSAPATAMTIGVLWPQTAIIPIAPAIGHWHATRSAIGY